MATISPLWEGISPTDFCLPESFSLLVFSTLQRRRCLSLIPPLDLGFRGRQYTRGGDGSSGPFFFSFLFIDYNGLTSSLAKLITSR
jgi:hypothetical protein